MKRLGFFRMLVLLMLAMSSCEKDDICSESAEVTPKVIIRFFDRLDTSRPNSAGTVKCFTVGNTKELVRSGNEIKLPLRLDSNTTSWVLELSTTNNMGESIVERDTLTFEYQIETTYINKACGFKSTFSLIDDPSKPRNPKLNNSNLERGNWIDRYDIMKRLIDNETDEHIKIFY